jgi:hypothetical protein
MVLEIEPTYLVHMVDIKIKPIDLRQINIKLSSSDSLLARVAGRMVRELRRMPPDFYPGTDRALFERRLREEDVEISRRRQSQVG